MSDLDELLASLPIDQISADLGEDPADVEAAARAALPALLGGMEANAQDPDGAASLLGALGQHEGHGISSLAEVDRADGEKITAHIFGSNRDQVVNQLGNTGASSGLVKKLLPILAPIVLSYIAKQMTGGSAPATTTASAGNQGVLGDLLGGLLKNAAGGSGNTGGGLGDILGGVLGGSSGGGLGGLLGGLLGGGKR